jgi:hypothetical protein
MATEKGDRINILGVGPVRIVTAANEDACSDGRTPKNLPDEPHLLRRAPDDGAVRRFGATAGRVLAVRAATGIDPEHAVEIVEDWARNKGRLHVCHVGCGHMYHAGQRQNREGYRGLHHTDPDAIQREIRSRATPERRLHSPVYEGPRVERAVVEVVSRDFTVVPAGRTPPFFRLDTTRNEQDLREIARVARRSGVPLSANQLIAADKRLAAATSGLLVPADLPHVRVHLNGGEPVVEQLGRTPGKVTGKGRGGRRGR